MSDNEKPGSENKPEFEVGFKKPPRDHQFKPGQSGNPSGRPKKKPRLITDAINKQLAKKVVLTEKSGRQITVTMSDVIAMRHTNQAAAGDHKSTAYVTSAQNVSSADSGDNLSHLLESMRELNAKHKKYPGDSGNGNA